MRETTFDKVCHGQRFIHAGPERNQPGTMFQKMGPGITTINQLIAEKKKCCCVDCGGSWNTINMNLDYDFRVHFCPNTPVIVGG